MSKIKVNLCSLAEKDHKKEKRYYAHWGHKPNTICIAKDFYFLPLNIKLALLLHEIGHALSDSDYEQEANDIIEYISGIKIKYASETPWGKKLQYIYPEEVSKAIKIIKKFISESSLRPFLR